MDNKIKYKSNNNIVYLCKYHIVWCMSLEQEKKKSNRSTSQGAENRYGAEPI